MAIVGTDLCVGDGWGISLLYDPKINVYSGTRCVLTNYKRRIAYLEDCLLEARERSTVAHVHDNTETSPSSPFM